MNSDSERPSLPKNQVTLAGLFSEPRFFLGLLCQMFVCATFQFMAPTLSLQLKTFELEPWHIGMFFALPCLVYVLLAPFMYLLTEKLQRRLVMVIGLLFLSLSMFLIGTTPALYLPHTTLIIAVGLVAMGLGAPMVSIPVLPEVLDSIE